MPAITRRLTAEEATAPADADRLTKGRAQIFDLRAFVDRRGIPSRMVTFADGAAIYRQGDPAASVFYIQHGAVKCVVVSSRGKEVIVGILEQGQFVGEGCLVDLPRRTSSASAMGETTVIEVCKPLMRHLLRSEPTLASRLLSHMLLKNIRLEEDLVDQLFNSSEKRLARVLLRLAHYGREDRLPELPAMSQETLAEMVGTTRSRINVFMTKFRRLGLIDYDRHIRVNNTLITFLLKD